jgi:hypothetical protein
MKSTINLSLAVMLALTCASASFGDTVVQTTVVTTTSPAPAAVAVSRDGFTESYSYVWVTQNGVKRVMPNNMKLRNGIVVHLDGVIAVPGNMNETLHSGDWLSFDGTLTRADSGKVEYLRPVY